MRIRNFLEIQQPPEQAGFRKNYSTLDHLHTINQIIEKSQEHGMKISLAFIDYNRAFDTSDHGFILETLKKKLPLQDQQKKHVSCTALVMNNTGVAYIE